MISGLIIGLVVGLTMCSRWAMLVAPLTRMIVIDLGRINVAGPTVLMRLWYPNFCP
jgi:hypothetical protein